MQNGGATRIRVLLADDHEIVRMGLRLLVESQPDMQVVAEASMGEEVVNAAGATGVDVAVLDLAMPGMGGLAAARALRDAGQPVKVVVLTRHEDSAYVRELMAAGCDGYVLKQSPSTALLEAIRAAFRGETYLDRALADTVALTRAAGSSRTVRAAVTGRERDVLRLTALGRSNKDIAAQLTISVKTVEVHKANAMRKLQLSDRADVVRYAVIQGWMKDP
jgi:two-component system, NarL family, response regulator NreC